jgi:DNA-binding response OmpR family regulator
MDRTRRILLVEDDPKLGRQVAGTLRAAGFEVEWLTDGAAALAAAPGAHALIVLDLMLPGAHGLDVLKHLRRGSDVPVLVLSAKSDATVKVRALELGADDYLTKPFWPEELLARVDARLRRPVMQRADRIESGALVIDLVARKVAVETRAVELTRVEFDLLLALARRPGAAITRASLAALVLDPEREGSERTLDVHMSRLRKKLGVAAPAIATVWGVGYRLEAPSPA